MKISVLWLICVLYYIKLCIAKTKFPALKDSEGFVFYDVDGCILEEDFLIDYIEENSNPVVLIKEKNALSDLLKHQLDATKLSTITDISTNSSTIADTSGTFSNCSVLPNVGPTNPASSIFLTYVNEQADCPTVEEHSSRFNIKKEQNICADVW